MNPEGKLILEIMGSYIALGITFTFVCCFLYEILKSKKYYIPTILEFSVDAYFFTVCAWIFFAIGIVCYVLFDVFPKWLANKCIK